MNEAGKTKPISQRWLDNIERLGNRLPNPVFLFIIFCAVVILASSLVSGAGINASHPLTGETLAARSLLSADGLRWMLTNAVSNFTQFAPVGPVIVAIMGIAIAEHSGLLAKVLHALTLRAHPRLLSAVVVFAGVLSSIGFDAGYVVLVPLAALIFKAAGRSPLAGIAAAFAGVSGGYSANLLLGPVDAVLAGISSEAIALLSPEREVLASSNYYFIIVSTLFVTVIGALVNDYLVEPRLPRPTPQSDADVDIDKTGELPTGADEQQSQRRPLLWVSVYSVVFALLMLWTVLPAQGLLRNPDPNGLAALPLLKTLVVWIALYAGGAGIVFGYSSGKYRSSNDWVAGMESGIATLTGYLVLMFFAAQFVNYFSWSGLGALAAISGADWLSSLALSKTSLLLLFILTSAAINLLIGSASAKWAVMAPVFVPMLALLGLTPEATQMAYRIGDSSTNIITPLMPYFGVIVAFMQSHDKEAGMGTLMSMMLPYSICFLFAWSGLLLFWLGFGLPLGPGG